MINMKKKIIGYLICDCDGVLLDSESVILEALYTQLKQYLPVSRLHEDSTLHNAIAERVGMMTDLLIGEINKQFKLNLTLADCNSVNLAVGQACNEKATPVPGVRKAIASIPLPRAVASNSSLDRINTGLSRAGLLDLFDGHIHSGCDLARPKPAPDVYLAAAAGYNAPLQRCIAIEDSVIGVRAAAAAGIQVMGFTGVAHNPKETGIKLLEAGAKEVFSDIQELTHVIKGKIT